MYSVIQFPFVNARLQPMAIFGGRGVGDGFINTDKQSEFLDAEKLHLSSRSDFSFYSISIPLCI